MISEAFLVCALALPPNKLWQYKFLAKLADDYGAEKIIMKRMEPHRKPENAERMPFIWNGFIVYFENSKKVITEEEAKIQLLKFKNYLKETAPDFLFVFLRSGLPDGAGWKRVGIEWDGYRIFAKKIRSLRGSA
jgi:hypothetical protein